MKKLELAVIAVVVLMVMSILVPMMFRASREENALVRHVRFQTTTGELIECRVRLEYPMERLSCELVK